jgi:signal peptidase II
VVLLVAAAVIALDQWTKSLVVSSIPLNGMVAPFPALEPYLKLMHFGNTGAAFGILRGQSSLFVAIALIAVVVTLMYSRQLPTDNRGVRVCLGLLLGGAISNNLIDRVRLGHVTDFVLLSAPIGGRVFDWPAFNVADSCIVCGTIGLGLILLWSDRQDGSG